MFHLAWPWLASCLPLPWLIRRLLMPAPPVSGGAVSAPFATVLGVSEATPSHSADRPTRPWGAIACWILLVMAAMRPQWLGEAVALPQTGRNLLLAVDVSGSMQIPDLENGATRLDVVKQVAGEFISRRKGDRIGLILFGTRPYLQAPLTFDRTTVAAWLGEAAIGIAGRETAIGDAIGMALKTLRGVTGKAVLVLLTDGTNTAGHVPPLKAAELAAQQGLRIYTVGIGGKPRAVQGLLGSQMIDPAADLDEKTLKTIAQSTGGRYFRATDRAALEDIYHRIDDLEPVGGDSQTVRPITELYPWPLGLAFLLSLALAIAAQRRVVAA